MRDRIPLALLGALPFALGSSVYAIDCSDVTGPCVVAASLNFADVDGAQWSIPGGGTVILPAGEMSWAITLSIWHHNLNLIGQTTTDAPTSSTANDLTIIHDDVPRIDGGASLIAVTLPAGKTCRISGITFTHGSPTETSTTGMIQLGGGASIRLDHCHLDDPCEYANQAIRTWGSWFGVIDHNVMIFRETLHDSNSIYFNMGNFGGGIYGNQSWAEPAYYGSEKFQFVEDNYIENASGGGLRGGFDGDEGCRFVIRHNELHRVNVIPHGTDSGAYRGSRAIEVYNNNFHGMSDLTPIGLRTGSFISTGNTFAGGTPPSNLLENYRLFVPFPPWGAANGANGWDVNATESDGTHVDGHTAYLFASGTVASGSTTTLVVSGTPWTAHHWQYYVVRRVSDGGYNVIQDNTSNTLSFLYTDAYGTQSPTWTGGDSYEIHKPSIVLDQPGRGAGDLLDATDFSNPVNSATGTVAWPHQALEPIYEWDDDGQVTTVHPTNAGLLQEGRDFYNGTAMPDYTPYTYPHPLVAGATPAPTPTPTLYLMLH